MFDKKCTGPGIESTNFKIFVKKNKTKLFGFHELLFAMFFGTSQIQKNYQRNSSTLKQALVNPLSANFTKWSDTLKQFVGG